MARGAGNRSVSACCVRHERERAIPVPRAGRRALIAVAGFAPGASSVLRSPTSTQIRILARALSGGRRIPMRCCGSPRSKSRGRPFDEQQALARRALAANPLDGRAYRVLADVAREQGDRERQRRRSSRWRFEHAPRDIAARTWAAQIALERGDAAAAFSHYDRILRVAPEAQTTIFPVLAGLASMPGARDALVSRLAEQPPWRESLLGTLRAPRRVRTTCRRCSRRFGSRAVSVRTRTPL